MQCAILLVIAYKKTTCEQTNKEAYPSTPPDFLLQTIVRANQSSASQGEEDDESVHTHLSSASFALVQPSPHSIDDHLLLPIVIYSPSYPSEWILRSQRITFPTIAEVRRVNYMIPHLHPSIMWQNELDGFAKSSPEVHDSAPQTIEHFEVLGRDGVHDIAGGARARIGEVEEHDMGYRGSKNEHRSLTSCPSTCRDVSVLQGAYSMPSALNLEKMDNYSSVPFQVNDC